MYRGLLCRFFRCAYHAKVMKQFEAIRSRVVLTITGMDLEKRGTRTPVCERVI
jgi:hypothetical protein